MMPALLALFAILAFLVGMIRPRILGGGRWRVLFVSIGLFVIAIIWTGSTTENDKGRQLDALVGQPNTSAPAPTLPVAPARPPAPDAQRRLVAVVDDYAARYEQASNDMARGALRPQRAATLVHGSEKETDE
jgi:hypothetical protein